MLIDIRFAADSDTHWIAELENISVQQTETNAFRIETTAGYDPRILLFNLAAQHDAPILELRTEEKNLEEIFRDFTS